MRLPRLTTRRLMVLVALMAVALWLGERRAERLERVEHYSRWVQKFRIRIQEAGPNRFHPSNQQRLEYFSDMEQRWTRASRYPWLPDPADPSPGR